MEIPMRKLFYTLLIASLVALEVFFILKFETPKPVVLIIKEGSFPANSCPIPALPVTPKVVPAPPHVHKAAPVHKKPEQAQVREQAQIREQASAPVFVITPSPTPKPSCQNPFGCFTPFKPFETYP